MKKFCLLFLTALLSVNMAFATTTFTNQTDKPVWVLFRAWGCFGLSDVGPFSKGVVCNDRRVGPGETIDYNFPWGTSGKVATIFGSKNEQLNDVYFYSEQEVSNDTAVAIPLGWGPKSKNDPNFHFVKHRPPIANI